MRPSKGILERVSAHSRVNVNGTRSRVAVAHPQHALASRCHRRSLARRPRARGHANPGLGRDLLSAGAHRAVDRRRARLVSPRVGLLIDRFGGHRVMPAGSLLAALGLFLLVHADHPATYLAVWMLLGVAIAAALYDPAFATLGRIFGAAARRPITALTLAGGFASTVSWPTTHLLLDAVGWRGTYLVYAALLALVAAPLHAFALPRQPADQRAPTRGAGSQSRLVPSAPHWLFIAVAAAFAAYAFVPSGLSAHLLAIFKRAGIDAAAVVIIGGCFGP